MTVDARGNTGAKCAGSNNIGSNNRGNFNIGTSNAGDCNVGKFNTGHYNTGNANKGDGNTGSYNAGDHNAGWFNSGNNCQGCFNTEDGAYGVFNDDRYTLTPSELPSMEGFKLVEWVPLAEMTDAHIALASARYATEHGGFLLEHRYKVAWRKFWATLSDERKDEFKSLTGFDAEIFEAITGVDVNAEEEESAPREVTVGGRVYRAVE